MRTVMLRYAHAFFNQVAQSAACNQFHSIQQRCCRWMLMTHDRMQSDEFLLTQEFLAMMLGVQRTGVTAAAGALQRAGLIRYKRGNVTITDRRGLQQRSCECKRSSQDRDAFLARKSIEPRARDPLGHGSRLPFFAVDQVQNVLVGIHPHSRAVSGHEKWRFGKIFQLTTVSQFEYFLSRKIAIRRADLYNL
jgi:hypothetical protein